MKDKKLRKFIHELCKKLGFAYDIDLNDYDFKTLDCKKWPLDFKDYERLSKKIDLLLDYLRLEIIENEVKIRKKKKNER